VLVAERFVEGVRVGTAVGRAEDDLLAAALPRPSFDRLRQARPNTQPAETFADDERRELAAGAVRFDEMLDV
jgi:hypothetical protein